MKEQTRCISERIKVNVTLVGHLSDLVGQRRIDIELDNHTLGGLVERISGLYGNNLIDSIVKAGTRELKVLILVNGMDVDFIRRLDTPLREGDNVDIVPMVAGG